ncbi:MAG: ABC transporter permease [Pseudomonadota bacterium]
MLESLLRVQWLQLRSDPVALISVFLLPIAFYSVSALMFGGMADGEGSSGPVTVLVVDQDQSPESRQFLERLQVDAEAMLDVDTLPSGDADARRRVQAGEVDAALLIPAAFAERLRERDLADLGLEIVYDDTNPVARYVLNSAVQGVLLRTGLALVPGSDALRLKPPANAGSDVSEVTFAAARSGAEGVATYYAAGIAVMFLLFSSARAGGSLLEERDEGTLERILLSDATMNMLLLSKWLFYWIQGFLQITAMMLWAWLVFDAEVFASDRIAALAVLTALTAGAASAFGVVLAVVFKTRAQLYGISSIVILIMSALGGSMAPRFLMPPIMDTIALFTFNGWALDGYLKLFWFQVEAAGNWQVLMHLGPQLGMLAGMTAVFLLIAQTLSRSWETL